MRAGLLALVAAAALALTAAPASAVLFREFSTTAPNTLPAGITSGPDGALWFAENGGNAVGRAPVDGTLGSFPIGGTNNLLGITRGPDGNLWVTDDLNGIIRRVTPTGGVTAFPLPTSSGAQDIVTGSDGALWYTMRNANKIGRITTTGTVTEYTLPQSTSLPYGIVSGPDNALWFAEESGRIGRITTSGAISEYNVPTPSAFPHDIAVGPDGAMWFTERDGNKIGRITTGGAINEYDLPTPQALPEAITNGPDGALWFTEGATEAIGRITPDGTISENPLPSPPGSPAEITTGPDGGIWYTRATDRVGRVDPTANPVTGSAVVVEPVEGTVLVRTPGSTFVSLTAGQVIPTGSEIDTTGGRIRLTAGVGTDTSATKTIDYYQGRFRITQPATPNAVLRATLSGPLGRCRARRAGHGAATSKKKRKLWGDGKGSYETKGRRGSGTVRGTIWLVQDNCDGSTLIKVQEGTVIARDFVKRKNKTLRAGQRYVARPRRR
jgi:streptogramin lyase